MVRSRQLRSSFSLKKISRWLFGRVQGYWLYLRQQQNVTKTCAEKRDSHQQHSRPHLECYSCPVKWLVNNLFYVKMIGQNLKPLGIWLGVPVKWLVNNLISVKSLVHNLVSVKWLAKIASVGKSRFFLQFKKKMSALVIVAGRIIP